MKDQQINGSQTRYVHVWKDSNKKEYVSGQVIGVSDGIYGVLLNNGDYIDVPEHQLYFVG